MTDERDPSEYWAGKTDPTELTTDALRREIEALKELINTRITAAEELAKEKFRAIAAQLNEADKQRLEQKADTKDAVAAALEAQEKAIEKSEGHTADQIKQLSNTVDTKVQALERSHSDLKERVTTVESIKAGAQEQKTEQRAITAGQLAAIGVMITLVVILVNLVVFLVSP